MNRSTSDEHVAARANVGRLALLCQVDGASAAPAIEEALVDAAERGWDDVRLALIHAKIIHAQLTDPASAVGLIDDLLADAERLDMPAMQAVALIDRIRGSRLLGIQEPYQTYAVARALLSDTSQPANDRASGLVNLAVEFELADLVELASDTLTQAADVAAKSSFGRDHLAVIEHNRAHALLRRAISAYMVHEIDRAKKLYDEHLPIVDALDENDVTTGDSPELRATRRVLEVLFADEDLADPDADELIDSLMTRDAELQTVLRSLMALERWPEELRDPQVVLAPEHEELTRFLRVRAYRRAGVTGDAYCTELERYNEVVVARAERARRELEAGVAAMVSAELLGAERHELVAMTLSDPLTGLANRRAFQRHMQPDDHRAASLILVDVDAFKAINDTYGHQVGDEVLIGLARLLREAAKPYRPEVVARIGGDEFAVVLTGECRDEASQLASSFAAGMATASWATPGLQPSASIGVASSSDRAQLFERADVDLYERKRRRPQRT